MAFRGEASAVRISDAPIASSDTGVATADQIKVAPSDAFRVRLAIGFILAVAVIDCVLYLPRVF